MQAQRVLFRAVALGLALAPIGGFAGVAAAQDAPTPTAAELEVVSGECYGEYMGPLLSFAPSGQELQLYRVSYDVDAALPQLRYPEPIWVHIQAGTFRLTVGDQEDPDAAAGTIDVTPAQDTIVTNERDGGERAVGAGQTESLELGDSVELAPGSLVYHEAAAFGYLNASGEVAVMDVAVLAPPGDVAAEDFRFSWCVMLDELEATPVQQRLPSAKRLAGFM